jgi:regulator of sirC expression with transglutaminase-like and TPR domain
MTVLKTSEWDKLPLIDACYLAGRQIRRDLPVDQIGRQLDELTDIARQRISQSPRAHRDAKLEQLLYLFYHSWGFQCSDGVYCLSDAIWIDRVLLSRRGTPAALGIILNTIAERLGLALTPVIFPTQLLLKTEWSQNSYWGINPSNGERLSLQRLRLWYEGYYGFGAEFDDSEFSNANNSQVIYNLLCVLKNAFMHEGKPEMALSVSQLMLFLNPNDPYIIRDRGLIYAQLECDHLALNDLHEFIEKCPDDPVADVVKMQMKSLKDNNVILH